MDNESPKHGKLWLWLDERVGLSDFAKLAKKKEVPLHRHTFWYYFGGMTLFLVHDPGRHRHSCSCSIIVPAPARPSNRSSSS